MIDKWSQDKSENSICYWNSNKFECMNVYKSYNKKLMKPIRHRVLERYIC